MAAPTRHTLTLLADGDPAAEERLPAMPDLSGEWAGSLTPHALCGKVCGEDWPDDIGDESELVDAIADAYEHAVLVHFERACAAVLARAAQ